MGVFVPHKWANTTDLGLTYCFVDSPEEKSTKYSPGAKTSPLLILYRLPWAYRLVWWVTETKLHIPLCPVSPSAPSTCLPGWWPHLATPQICAVCPDTLATLLLETAEHLAVESQSRSWWLGESLFLLSATQVKKAGLPRRHGCLGIWVSLGVRLTLVLIMSCCPSSGHSPCDKAWLLCWRQVSAWEKCSARSDSSWFVKLETSSV